MGGRPVRRGNSGEATAGADGAGAGLRAARFSRAFLRFSMRFSFSSMRTVMNFITRSATRSRRSISLTVSGLRGELQQDVLPFVVLQHAVGELANAPLFGFVDRAAAWVITFFNCSISGSTSSSVASGRTMNNSS